MTCDVPPPTDMPPIPPGHSLMWCEVCDAREIVPKNDLLRKSQLQALHNNHTQAEREAALAKREPRRRAS